MRDLLEPGWRRGLQQEYDVVAAANSLHWFSMRTAAKLFSEILELLRPGGAFVFLEPAGPEPAYTPGFNGWKDMQPVQHKREDWIRFWTRVNTLLGYDHIKQLGARSDQNRIHDKLSVLGWVRLVSDAGFENADVLLRDPEKVVLIALKPFRQR
jgi:SAM-dependent methyltransferase